MPKNNNNAQTSTAPWAVQARQQEAQAQEARRQNLLQSGFTYANPGVLDRTTADIVAGKKSVPTAQLNPEQQRMIKIHYLNEDVTRGSITPEQYQSKLAEIEGRTEQLKHERTAQFGREAEVKGRSETAKQREAREIAERQGVAVGTISGCIANISSNSKEFKNRQVSEFANAQKNLMSQQQEKKTEQVKANNIGTGTTDDPYKSAQPDQSLVSPFLQTRKEVQGPQRESLNYTLSLSDSIGGKEKTREFKGPYENIVGTFGKQQSTFLGSAIEGGLKSLDKFTSTPITSPYAWLVEPFKHPAGFFKETLAGVGFLSNLGTYTGAWLRGRETPITKPIDIVDTSPGIAVSQLMQGKNPLESKELKQYVQKYGASTVMGEVSTFYTGSGAKALSPLKGQKFTQPGVSISKSVVSGKTAINTPQIISKEIGIKTISLGYGTKTKPIISSVGGKISFGAPKLEDVTVSFTPTTGKQVQRGVKLAADSSQLEQKLSAQLIQKSTISKGEKEKAVIIEELVDITTTKKSDTKTAEALSRNAFESVTPTEQPSFMAAFTKGQKRIINPIGKFEGSLSQSYFVLPKFLRKAGDVDLHASTYGKAKGQVEYIVPKIKADPDRTFFGVTSEKTKSAKIYAGKTKGEKEKVIEILNPEEKDLEGILQSVEGETIFGKKIPSKTYKVEEGKTYGRQRQILKKGESLYSIQTDPITGEQSLGAAKFRSRKDTADFFALVESARVVEFAEGSKESTRISELLKQFKSKFETDDFKIEEYLTKNKQPERVTFNVEPSIIQNIGRSTISQGSKGLVKTPSLIKESTPKETKDTSFILSENKQSLIQKNITPKTIRATSLSSISRTRYTPPKQKSLGSIDRIQRQPTSIQSIDKRPKSISQSPSIPKSAGIMISLGGASVGKSLTGKSLGGPKPREPRVQKILRLSGPSDTKQLSSYTQKRRVVVPGIILLKNTTKKAPGLKGRSEDFIGDVKISSIMGWNRDVKNTIAVGTKTSSRLYQKQLGKEKKESDSLFSLKKGSSKKKDKISFW